LGQATATQLSSFTTMFLNIRHAQKVGRDFARERMAKERRRKLASARKRVERSSASICSKSSNVSTLWKPVPTSITVDGSDSTTMELFSHDLVAAHAVWDKCKNDDRLGRAVVRALVQLEPRSRGLLKRSKSLGKQLLELVDMLMSHVGPVWDVPTIQAPIPLPPRLRKHFVPAVIQAMQEIHKDSKAASLRKVLTCLMERVQYQ